MYAHGIVEESCCVGLVKGKTLFKVFLGHSQMIANVCQDIFALKRCLQHGTVDSARSSLAHHRPLVGLNARMTSVAPAQNGAFMHTPTKTPRVHCLTTSTHARRRAGHPLAGGRLGKQNAVRAILGRLVSSSRKNRSILEDAVRQAYSPDSL